MQVLLSFRVQPAYCLRAGGNIPQYSPTSTPAYYPGSDAFIVDDQNAGVVMMGATGYNLSSNVFQTNATVSTPTPRGYYNYTTGTIEQNTGSDNNQVTDNTFSALNVAMLSNFKNNGATTGLQYLCNTDTRVGYDISAHGSHTTAGGINPVQGTSSTGSSTYDRPAGNYFSTHQNVDNYQASLYYNYYGATSPSNPQYPALITGSTVSLADYSSPAVCYPIPGTASIGPYTTASLTGLTLTSASSGGSLAYRLATVNVNYYMTDLNGSLHRDSLYYWAGMMGTPSGALLKATMFVEDSLIDSANLVYDSIALKYNLDPVESNEYVQGRSLMDLLIAKRLGDRNLRSLTAPQVATLQYIKGHASMWAHARAEGWLLAYNGEALVDTLLFPATAETETGDGDGGGRMSAAHGHTAQPIASMAQAGNYVFPNPVHDLLQVLYTTKFAENATIQIEDVSGRIIITQPLPAAGQSSVDMSGLAPGFYLYRIFEGKEATMIGKIIKD